MKSYIFYKSCLYFVVFLIFSSCNSNKQEAAAPIVASDTVPKLRIPISQCDSAYVYNIWQSRESNSFPELHFCMNQDSVWVYSDTTNLTHLFVLDEEMYIKQNTLFDLLVMGLQQEKKKYRKRTIDLDECPEDYRIRLFSNNILAVDTIVSYEFDYEYLSDDLFLGIGNLISLFEFYNSQHVAHRLKNGIRVRRR